MAQAGPRILLIGGTYRTLCILEYLLERGERIAGFLGQEGGAERDFASEILEQCSRANIPTRSASKFGEEMVRWIEDCIRPELALALGVTTEIPLAIGGNCRFGLVEIEDCLVSENHPGVELNLRGRVIDRRKIPLEDREDPDELYLRVIDETVEAISDYLYDLGRPGSVTPVSVPFEAPTAALEDPAALGEFVAAPAPGEETDLLEREAAGYLGADHTLALRSLDDAFALLLGALDLSADDEVICSPLSGNSLLEGIRATGARPVFADIDPDRLSLDPEQVERALTKHTRALVIGHPFGQAAELDRLYAVGHDAGIEVIEDAGGALGAQFAGEPLGKSPCTCVFRLSRGAVLPGTEAVLVTLSETLAQHLEPRVAELRLGNASAAHARRRLAQWDDALSLRRQHAQEYSGELARYDAFEIPPTPEEALPVYSAYPLRLTRFSRSSADDLHKLLGDSGIEARRIHVPLSERDIVRLPITEALQSHGLLLPLGEELRTDQRSLVLDYVFDFTIG